MSGKTILAILLTASLCGNAAFLVTSFLHRRVQPVGALEQLSLTEEQSSKLEAAKKAFQGERASAQKRMAELRGVLADEFQKDSADGQMLLGTATEMTRVQASMRPKVVDHLMVLHALLNAEQRASLARVMRTGAGPGAACPAAMLYPTSDQGE